MTFKEYVDGLCKQGIVDGHIAEMLCGLHEKEAANPKEAVMGKVKPILDEMWESRAADKFVSHETLADFADRIDDGIQAV